MKKTISILGSTGSVGQTSLEILSKKKNFFDINLLYANKNLKLICHQIKKYKPDIAAIEKFFVSNSGESALKLGMARGVALNSLVSQRQIIIKELAARYIKKAITGTGAADKGQIKYMIEKLLGKIVVQSDAADALAIAIAGYNTPNESLNSLKLNYDKKKYSNHKLNNAIRKALDKG